eukprot:52850-Eustigmatos_ZCMA.PRE.1
MLLVLLLVLALRWEGAPSVVRERLRLLLRDPVAPCVDEATTTGETGAARGPFAGGCGVAHDVAATVRSSKRSN